MASFQPEKGLILIALPQEMQALQRSLSSSLKKSYENRIHLTGLGKVQATFHTTHLIQKFKPEWILNIGTAGSRKHAPGHMVEAVHFVQRDSIFVQFGQKNLSVSPLTSLPRVTCGTGDFIETTEPLVACDIYDMEGYALAYVCEQMKVRFQSLKYISDSSDENVLKDWKASLEKAGSAWAAELEKILST